MIQINSFTKNKIVKKTLRMNIQTNFKNHKAYNNRKTLIITQNKINYKNKLTSLIYSFKKTKKNWKNSTKKKFNNYNTNKKKEIIKKSLRNKIYKII